MRDTTTDTTDVAARIRRAVRRAVQDTQPAHLIDLCEEVSDQGPQAWRQAAQAAATQCARQLGIRAPQPGAGSIYEAALPEQVRRSAGQHTAHRMIAAHMDSGAKEAARVLDDADDATAQAAGVALLVVCTAGAGYDPAAGDELRGQVWGPVEEREQDQAADSSESAHSYQHAQAPGGTVTVGWDAPLSTYYAYVEDPEAEDDEDAYPVSLGGIPYAVRTVSELAEAMPYPIPQHIRQQLTADRYRKGEQFGAGPLDQAIYRTSRRLEQVTTAQVAAMEAALGDHGQP